MKYYCQNCQKKLEDDYKPVTCCSGLECGCMGRLLEPIVCSDPKCWSEAVKPAPLPTAADLSVDWPEQIDRRQV